MIFLMKIIQKNLVEFGSISVDYLNYKAISSFITYFNVKIIF